jgi:hypothetical protein
MEPAGHIGQASKKSFRGLVFAAIVAVVTLGSIGLYAVAGTSSNTIVITPRVAPGGAGGAGSTAAANFTDIGEDFKSHPKEGKEIKGQVVTQIDLPVGIETGNLVLDLLWTNSADVKGPLDKENGYLHVGLYFMDDHQQKAEEKGYAGACDDLTQLEWKEKVLVPGVDGKKDKTKDVKRYICPDISANAQNNLSKFFANGILASTINGHQTLYLVADIPKVPKLPKPPKEVEENDEDDSHASHTHGAHETKGTKGTKDTKATHTASALGWEKASKVGKLEFHISLIAI